MSPPSSGMKIKQARNQHEEGSKQDPSCYIIHAGLEPGSLFNPEV
jgi:hypothetical protein